MKREDVFTPNSPPTHTYVARNERELELQLEMALKVKNTLISISGPSKTGKTALVSRVLKSDNIIKIAGSEIVSEGALWRRALAWMEVPGQETRLTQIEAGAKVPILPAIADISGKYVQSTSSTYSDDGLARVCHEIADSDFLIFIDDFHYINRDVQKAVAKDIKTGLEHGLKICVASVPHRADDAVRSNHELAGRISNIDTDYWTNSELVQIGTLGFKALNVGVDNEVLGQMASQCFGSPQLMQTMCLNVCVVKNIEDRYFLYRDIDVTEEDIKKALRMASRTTNFQHLVRQLHLGPRVRGTERKEFRFSDHSRGDVYRAVLLAISADPPLLNMQYRVVTERVAAVCLEDNQPNGSSVNEALKQMDKISKEAEEPDVLEWDEENLSIMNPYFMFYLRNSDILGRIQAE